MKHLSEIADIRSGYTFRSSLSDFAHGDTNVIQAKDITKLESAIFPRVHMAKAERCLRYGDVLLSVKGGFKAEVFYLKKQSVASSSIIVIRPHKGILPEYLSLYLNSISGQNTLKNIATGAAIKTLTISELSNLIIPIPPDTKQRQLIDISQNIKRQQELIARKNKLLNSILNSIMAITTKERQDD